MSEEKTNTSKLWGGRFAEATDAFVQRFTASVEFDKRLYKADIEGSVAHATMLEKAGILSSVEKTQIISGLHEIQNDIETSKILEKFA